MKKKTYISPEVVTVELPKMPLMAGSPDGFNNSVDQSTKADASTGLAKEGWVMWSDDEPEEVDY